MESRTPPLLPVVQPDLLQHARIETPCHADWDAMNGDDVSRHCDECQLTVLHLSRLPRAAAEEALRNRGERLCVRMTLDRHGRVLSAEDLAAPPRRRGPRWWARVASWLLLGLGGSGLAACVDRSSPPPTVPPIDDVQDPTPDQDLMGEVWIPEHEITGGQVVDPPATGERELMGDVSIPEEQELMGRVVCELPPVPAPDQDGQD